MKVLGNLNLTGNQIRNVSAVLDVNGNPIGGGSLFKLYDAEFDSTDVTDTDSEEDASGNYVYFKYITIAGDTHGIANPVVQVFEESNDMSKKVDVDIEIDNSTNDVVLKFVSDDSYNVPEWESDTVYYKCRIMGYDASAISSGSGSGNGN